MARALTSPLGSFIGRRSELAALERLGRSERLLTLVGPGGVGKTRLAAELSARAARRGELVGTAELAPLEKTSGIGSAVAAAFGVAGDEGALIAWLQDRPARLVLDNCEHLTDAVAEVVTDLLARAAGLHIVTTSREPLGLSAERTWPVPPLSLPDADRAGWERSDAVRLFVERAGAAVPRFAANALTAPRLVEICRRLDGLPLAIELAAKTLATVPLEDLLRAVAEPLDLGRGATTSARPDVIRATIARSHALLDERERQAFRRLGIFSGSFTGEAAEHVCADGSLDRNDVFAIVAGLAHKSLVEPIREGGGRYRMLEVIRRFALERLRESQEVDLAERRRAEHVARLFQEFDPPSNPNSGQLLGRILSDHPNVSGAMSWALANDLPIARSIAAKVWLVYLSAGPGIDPAEVEGWVERTLAADPTPDEARARMLLALSQRRFAANDRAASRRHAEDALAVASASGDHHAAGGAHHRLAMLAHADGDLGLAVSGYTEARHEYGLAHVTAAQAWALAMRAAARGLGGDGAGALRDFAEAAALVRSPSFPRVLAIVRTLEGEHHTRHGELGDARRCFEECVSIYQQHGPGVIPLARALHGLADVAARSAQAERALRLAGAAEAIASRSGETWPSAGPTPSLDTAARTLGSRAEAVRDEGRRATVDESISLALGTRPTGAGLSRREREVAALVSEGLTSREIADRLGISERTAENHVEHMLVKLGLRSRAQIARWAAEQARSTT